MPDDRQLLLKTYRDGDRFVQARVVSLDEAVTVIATLPQGWHSHLRHPDNTKLSNKELLEVLSAMLAFNRRAAGTAAPTPPTEG